MKKPMVREHNVTTNEIIDREMTDEEFEVYQAQQVIDAEELAALAQAETAKEIAQAKLAALGLTVDDLKALGL